MLREALTPERIHTLRPAEVAACFIMRRADGLTASEQQLLERWLAQDEAHRQAFDSADQAWQSLADTEGDEILAAMRAQALSARPRAGSAWRPMAAAAAILLLAVCVTLLVSPTLHRPGAQKPGVTQIALLQFRSPHGMMRHFQLPDGSTLTLDADSIALGRFGSNQRAIELQQGRAFFEIIPDKSRPFTVTAAGRSIVAVGTSFDVNLLKQGLMVTLLHGKVAVTALDSAERLMLEPGQQYIERAGKVITRSLGPASENAAAWRVGLINFDDQPLAEAVAMMNRYSSEIIVVDDPNIAALRVSGQFHAADSQRFAATVAEMHHLRVIHAMNRTELVR
jgi:transmembrane sensor